MPGEITFIDCGSFTKTIVIGGDGFLRGFNKENGYCIGEWIVTNPSFRNCVYCAVPHYYHIVFGTDDGFVRFLNTSTFSVEEEFPAHSAPVTKLLSINLNTLLTYSEPIIKLWKKVVNVYECINQIETKLFAPIDVFYIRQENVKFTTTNSMVYTIKDGTYEQDSLIEDHIIPKPPLDYSIRIEEKEVVIEAKKDSIQIPIPSNVTASDCQTDCFGIGCNEDFFFWTINVKIG
ncbi:hypothetical protein GPJ56_006792 [Histomonas meleagridis]|uniref:uncharacterized protein n=1 Tax=Histomonas meleagridis TaxID=135588 RepID=UPI003559EB95|nr:hypothetical protein GPJ56_006792 [Histomonas meleagridis]KAH0800201.1 hypothetical protein GO595_007313 [Histomonas meleagridis]